MAGLVQSFEIPRSRWQRRSLALDPKTPPRVLAKLIQNTRHPTPVGTRRAVARNPSTPPGTLAVLARDPDATVRRIVAANERTPIAAIQLLMHDPVIGDQDAAFHATISSGSLPADEGPRDGFEAIAAVLYDGAASLVRKEYDAFLQDGSERTALPPGALAILAQSPLPSVRAAVAASRKVDAETLELLAFDDHPRVLKAVAGRHGGDLGIQEILAGAIWISEVGTAGPSFDGRFTEIALALAKNHSTSSEILATLAHHHDPLVREHVAKSPNASVETLAALADDNVIEVLLNVAGNENSQPATIAHLVARRPRSRSLQYGGPLLLEGFVMNMEDAVTASSPDFARSYIGYDWSTVLNRLAEHPNTSSADLITLAEHGYDLHVAQNPHAPAPILEKLARQAQKIPGYDEHDRWVDDNSLLRAISENPNTPPPTLEDLFHETKGYSYIAEGIAKNPRAPAALLLEMARTIGYGQSDLRRELVENPATPPEALAILEKNADPFVKELIMDRRWWDERNKQKPDPP